MGVAGRVVLLMMGDGWVRGSARMMRSADAFEGGLMCRGSADALEGALIFSRGCDRRFDVDPTRISKCKSPANTRSNPKARAKTHATCPMCKGVVVSC